MCIDGLPTNEQSHRERGFEGFRQAPFSNHNFLKVGSYLSSLNTKYNSLHIDQMQSRIYVLTHLSCMLIKSPVKTSATKIIYALDLLHVMLSRIILAVFMRCNYKLICLRVCNG